MAGRLALVRKAAEAGKTEQIALAPDSRPPAPAPGQPRAGLPVMAPPPQDKTPQPAATRLPAAQVRPKPVQPEPKQIATPGPVGTTLAAPLPAVQPRLPAPAPVAPTATATKTVSAVLAQSEPQELPAAAAQTSGPAAALAQQAIPEPVEDRSKRAAGPYLSAGTTPGGQSPSAKDDHVFDEEYDDLEDCESSQGACLGKARTADPPAQEQAGSSETAASGVETETKTRKEPQAAARKVEWNREYGPEEGYELFTEAMAKRQIKYSDYYDEKTGPDDYKRMIENYAWDRVLDGMGPVFERSKGVVQLLSALLFGERMARTAKIDVLALIDTMRVVTLAYIMFEIQRTHQALGSSGHGAHLDDVVEAVTRFTESVRPSDLAEAIRGGTNDVLKIILVADSALGGSGAWCNNAVAVVLTNVADGHYLDIIRAGADEHWKRAVSDSRAAADPLFLFTCRGAQIHIDDDPDAADLLAMSLRTYLVGQRGNGKSMSSKVLKTSARRISARIKTVEDQTSSLAHGDISIEDYKPRLSERSIPDFEAVPIVGVVIQTLENVLEMFNSWVGGSAKEDPRLLFSQTRFRDFVMRAALRIFSHVCFSPTWNKQYGAALDHTARQCAFVSQQALLADAYNPADVLLMRFSDDDSRPMSVRQYAAVQQRERGSETDKDKDAVEEEKMSLFCREAETDPQATTRAAIAAPAGILFRDGRLGFPRHEKVPEICQRAGERLFDFPDKLDVKSCTRSLVGIFGSFVNEDYPQTRMPADRLFVKMVSARIIITHLYKIIDASPIKHAIKPADVLDIEYLLAPDGAKPPPIYRFGDGINAFYTISGDNKELHAMLMVILLVAFQGVLRKHLAGTPDESDVVQNMSEAKCSDALFVEDTSYAPRSELKKYIGFDKKTGNPVLKNVEKMPAISVHPTLEELSARDKTPYTSLASWPKLDVALHKQTIIDVDHEKLHGSLVGLMDELLPRWRVVHNAAIVGNVRVGSAARCCMMSSTGWMRYLLHVMTAVRIMIEMHESDEENMKSFSEYFAKTGSMRKGLSKEDRADGARLRAGIALTTILASKIFVSWQARSRHKRLVFSDVYDGLDSGAVGALGTDSGLFCPRLTPTMDRPAVLVAWNTQNGRAAPPRNLLPFVSVLGSASAADMAQIADYRSKIDGKTSLLPVYRRPIGALPQPSENIITAIGASARVDSVKTHLAQDVAWAHKPIIITDIETASSYTSDLFGLERQVLAFLSTAATLSTETENCASKLPDDVYVSFMTAAYGTLSNVDAVQPYVAHLKTIAKTGTESARTAAWLIANLLEANILRRMIGMPNIDLASLDLTPVMHLSAELIAARRTEEHGYTRQHRIDKDLLGFVVMWMSMLPKQTRRKIITTLNHIDVGMSDSLVTEFFARMACDYGIVPADFSTVSYDRTLRPLESISPVLKPLAAYVFAVRHGLAHEHVTTLVVSDQLAAQCVAVRIEPRRSERVPLTFVAAPNRHFLFANTVADAESDIKAFNFYGIVLAMTLAPIIDGNLRVVHSSDATISFVEDLPQDAPQTPERAAHSVLADALRDVLRDVDAAESKPDKPSTAATKPVGSKAQQAAKRKEEFSAKLDLFMRDKKPLPAGDKKPLPAGDSKEGEDADAGTEVEAEEDMSGIGNDLHGDYDTWQICEALREQQLWLVPMDHAEMPDEPEDSDMISVPDVIFPENSSCPIIFRRTVFPLALEPIGTSDSRDPSLDSYTSTYKAVFPATMAPRSAQQPHKPDSLLSECFILRKNMRLPNSLGIYTRWFGTSRHAITLYRPALPVSRFTQRQSLDSFTRLSGQPSVSSGQASLLPLTLPPIPKIGPEETPSLSYNEFCVLGVLPTAPDSLLGTEPMFSDDTPLDDVWGRPAPLPRAANTTRQWRAAVALAQIHPSGMFLVHTSAEQRNTLAALAAVSGDISARANFNIKHDGRFIVLDAQHGSPDPLFWGFCRDSDLAAGAKHPSRMAERAPIVDALAKCAEDIDKRLAEFCRKGSASPSCDQTVPSAETDAFVRDYRGCCEVTPLSPGVDIRMVAGFRDELAMIQARAVGIAASLRGVATLCATKIVGPGDDAAGCRRADWLPLSLADLFLRHARIREWLYSHTVIAILNTTIIRLNNILDGTEFGTDQPLLFSRLDRDTISKIRTSTTIPFQTLEYALELIDNRLVKYSLAHAPAAPRAKPAALDLVLAAGCLTEIATGFLMRNDQFALINDIVARYDNPDLSGAVDKLIMGSGKSSFVTPWLIAHQMLEPPRHTAAPSISSCFIGSSSSVSDAKKKKKKHKKKDDDSDDAKKKKKKKPETPAGSSKKILDDSDDDSDGSAFDPDDVGDYEKKYGKEVVSDTDTPSDEDADNITEDDDDVASPTKAMPRPKPKPKAKKPKMRRADSAASASEFGSDAARSNPDSRRRRSSRLAAQSSRAEPVVTVEPVTAKTDIMIRAVLREYEPDPKNVRSAVAERRKQEAHRNPPSSNTVTAIRSADPDDQKKKKRTRGKDDDSDSDSDSDGAKKQYESGPVARVCVVVPEALYRQTQDIVYRATRVFGAIEFAVLDSRVASRKPSIVERHAMACNLMRTDKYRGAVLVTSDKLLQEHLLVSIADTQGSPYKKWEGGLGFLELLRGATLVFDEVDTLTDPMSCTMNMPTGAKQLLNDDACVGRTMLQRIIRFISCTVNKDADADGEKARLAHGIHPKIYEKIVAIVLDVAAGKLAVGRSFGFGSIQTSADSRVDKQNYLLAIPYGGANNPLDSSRFSDVELTLVLTYFCYRNAIMELSTQPGIHPDKCYRAVDFDEIVEFTKANAGDVPIAQMIETSFAFATPEMRAALLGQCARRPSRDNFLRFRASLMARSTPDAVRRGIVDYQFARAVTCYASVSLDQNSVGMLEFMVPRISLRRAMFSGTTNIHIPKSDTTSSQAADFFAKNRPAITLIKDGSDTEKSYVVVAMTGFTCRNPVYNHIPDIISFDTPPWQPAPKHEIYIPPVFSVRPFAAPSQPRGSDRMDRLQSASLGAKHHQTAAPDMDSDVIYQFFNKHWTQPGAALIDAAGVLRLRSSAAYASVLAVLDGVGTSVYFINSDGARTITTLIAAPPGAGARSATDNMVTRERVGSLLLLHVDDPTLGGHTFETRAYTGSLAPTKRHIFFYDQKNTVGIDFVQPNFVWGLVIVDGSTLLTKALQAAFRLRKLARGHTFDYFYAETTPISATGSRAVAVYRRLMQNENAATESRKAHSALANLLAAVRTYSLVIQPRQFFHKLFVDIVALKDGVQSVDRAAAFAEHISASARRYTDALPDHLRAVVVKLIHSAIGSVAQPFASDTQLQTATDITAQTQTNVQRHTELEPEAAMRVEPFAAGNFQLRYLFDPADGARFSLPPYWNTFRAYCSLKLGIDIAKSGFKQLSDECVRSDGLGLPVSRFAAPMFIALLGRSDTPDMWFRIISANDAVALLYTQLSSGPFVTDDRSAAKLLPNSFFRYAIYSAATGSLIASNCGSDLPTPIPGQLRGHFVLNQISGDKKIYQFAKLLSAIGQRRLDDQSEIAQNIPAHLQQLYKLPAPVTDTATTYLPPALYRSHHAPQPVLIADVAAAPEGSALLKVVSMPPAYPKADIPSEILQAQSASYSSTKAITVMPFCANIYAEIPTISGGEKAELVKLIRKSTDSPRIYLLAYDLLIHLDAHQNTPTGLSTELYEKTKPFWHKNSQHVDKVRGFNPVLHYTGHLEDMPFFRGDMSHAARLARLIEIISAIPGHSAAPPEYIVYTELAKLAKENVSQLTDLINKAIKTSKTKKSIVLPKSDRSAIARFIIDNFKSS